MYTAQKEKVREETQRCGYVAFTTDIWTSVAVDGYMTITCHYLDSKWKLCTKVLTTAEMPEHHTGVNIAVTVSFSTCCSLQVWILAVQAAFETFAVWSCHLVFKNAPCFSCFCQSRLSLPRFFQSLYTYMKLLAVILRFFIRPQC